MAIMFRISDSSQNSHLTLSEKSRSFVLGAKEEYYIGRRPDNDIHLNSTAISGRHAKVTHLLSDTFVEDVGSSNGTFINGEKVEKYTRLRHSDLITIGTYQMHYVNDDESEENAFFQKEWIVCPRTPLVAAAIIRQVEQCTREAKKPLSTVTGEEEAEALAAGRIAVQNPEGESNVLDLRKVVTSLGRQGKPVAAFSRRSEGVFLTHIASAGDKKDEAAPLVNGKSVGIFSCLLKDGDKITVQGVDMLFNVK